jgi:hypothetical protein
MKALERYWINQPSTLQPHHKMHGKNVLARLGVTINRKLKNQNPLITTVYFVDGDTISADIFTNSLSPGWK